MTLAALIRKRETGKPANANPANPANPANGGQGKAGTLATLATLALAKPEPAWRWLMHYADGYVEIRFSPEVSHAEALAKCPGAIAAEPIPETPARKPTEAEAAELSRLVSLAYPDETDRAEALAAALADPGEALTCYRAIADREGKVQ